MSDGHFFIKDNRIKKHLKSEEGAVNYVVVSAIFVSSDTFEDITGEHVVCRSCRRLIVQSVSFEDDFIYYVGGVKNDFGIIISGHT